MDGSTLLERLFVRDPLKIHGVLGLLTLVLFADTAFGQEEATRNRSTFNWGDQVEKRVGLKLDDKLSLPFSITGESGAGTATAPARVQSEESKSRPYLADRGDGIHTSQFGTYVRKDELLVYVYYEFYTNHDAEYKPQELGFNLDKDFFAKRVAHEGLVFVSYGITEHLAVEFDSALYTTASQHKSPDDPSSMPNTLREWGLGDTEAQIRFRWFEETEQRPELITYLGAVFPLQKHESLIGTRHWEVFPGVNVTKGFSWGTLMLKASGEYTEADGGTVDFGEYGIEYVKKLSDRWRLVLSVDGTGDEVEAIGEMQWRMSPLITIKLNNGFGLTPKATDWAPEIGILFYF
jgi:hypothetical protein